jgi:1-acyl-sn-glycerol-3-phosphate acyltransferase
MGKDTLFRGPLGLLMRSLGGIPVNRREHTPFFGTFFDFREVLIIVYSTKQALSVGYPNIPLHFQP